MSETAIRAPEQKLAEQDRALLAKSNREKKRATKKQNDKNDQIQLSEKPKCKARIDGVEMHELEHMRMGRQTRQNKEKNEENKK